MAGAIINIRLIVYRRQDFVTSIRCHIHLKFFFSVFCSFGHSISTELRA